MKSHLSTVDDQLKKIAREVAPPELVDATVRLMQTALAIGSGASAAQRIQMMNRALGELHQTATLFASHKHVRKIAVFGSARATPEQEEFQMAAQLATDLVRSGFMVITGAGPGIMAAAQKGAGAEDSFGLRILLPFENQVNETIEGDAKLLEFEYFFTRKLSFVWESSAFVLFPGGLGTLDESFEILTLMQTGKMPVAPVVMIERPGGTYWEGWRRFITECLLNEGHVSAQDLNLFHLSHGIEDAMEHIGAFYHTFHSYAWHGEELEILIQQPLTPKALAELNHSFNSLLARGSIVQAPAAAPTNAPACVNPHTLSLIPRQRCFGELRLLIDAINTLPLEASAVLSASLA